MKSQHKRLSNKNSDLRVGAVTGRKGKATKSVLPSQAPHWLRPALPPQMTGCSECPFRSYPGPQMVLDIHISTCEK